MAPTVQVRCCGDEPHGVEPDHVVVMVDVIRSATTAMTAVALGRRCLLAETIDDAVAMAAELPGALLAGELGGHMPFGFELNNSPALVAARTDVERPLVLVSTSGTHLARSAALSHPTFIASLRNHAAQAADLAAAGRSVALLGAATRGEFRDEDQLCCSLIADALVRSGFEPREEAAAVIDRWRGAPIGSIRASKSADYLTRSGQAEDLEFIMSHVDDLAAVFRMEGAEVCSVPVERGGSTSVTGAP
jgi:2-phosphosulfolactate phosphatase